MIVFIENMSASAQCLIFALVLFACALAAH
jgi:hypothetical protein